MHNIYIEEQNATCKVVSETLPYWVRCEAKFDPGWIKWVLGPRHTMTICPGAKDTNLRSK
jgi:hypothetical protein